MEHIYPGVFEPVSEVIDGMVENLLSLPARRKERIQSQKAQKERLENLDARENAIHEMERLCTAQKAELAAKEQELSERFDAGRIHRIPVGEILPNPYQPRREFEDLALFSLTDSIRRHGILQPLTVRRTEQVPPLPDCYTLICGERRLRAAIAAGLETVPCILLEASDRRAAELALIENLQRENLNMFEQAGAIAALIDMHAMTQEQIAKSLSVSQSCIANRLRILRLTEPEREMILSSHLTERHARAFLRIKALEERKAAIQYVMEHGLNVAKTEEYIDKITAKKEEPFHVEQESEKIEPTKKVILKDLRLFFNTVDRAVGIIRDAGIPAECQREEYEDGIRVVIRLPKTK